MRLTTTAAVALSLVTLNAQAELSKDDRKEIEEAVKTFQAKAELKPAFKTAFGYAVFPTVGHGAFGIGVAHGSGGVYKQGALVATTSMTQVSIGLGAGGEAYSEIIFFKDKDAFNRFAGGNFELGARATATAAKNSKVSDADYNNGVLIVTATKGGLMADASVGGQKFSYDKL
jgi:lipid-binding SYLF domain-containing protein